MKTNCIAKLAGITVGLLFLAGGAAEVKAQNGAKGGATKLLELSGLQRAAKTTEAAVITPMSCGKCKDQYSQRGDLSARGANKPTVFVATHLCAGCGTDWDVVGHGKAKVSVATHKCISCGAETLTCCNTRGATVATKGMEKKIEIAPLK
jgi:hypothetical protein